MITTLKEHYSKMENVPGIGISDKGDRHPTHKHFYIDVYDKLFSDWKDTPVKLMELGIASGASLLMWSTYFTNGTITGFDISEPSRKDILEKIKNIGMIFGDAYIDANANYLVNHLPKQDVFIDDGAHTIESQLNALKNYHKLVRPGGYYICEDMFVGNLGQYMIEGVYNITGRTFTTTIYDGHRRLNGLSDDIMIVIQFLS